MSRHRGDKGTDFGLKIVIYGMLIIFMMPIAGLIFLLRDDPSLRGLGLVLLVVGIILWIAML